MSTANSDTKHFRVLYHEEIPGTQKKAWYEKTMIMKVKAGPQDGYDAWGIAYKILPKWVDVMSVTEML